MIEVRDSYLVKVKDIREAILLWQRGRDAIWPDLGWQGRIQQMLHGHAQQSLFVWSSEWDDLAAWEAGVKRARSSVQYEDWTREISELCRYGSEREVFTILEPSPSADNRPGRVEVRSSYVVPIARAQKAREHLRRGMEVEGMSGQCEQMLHGKASQSMFVISTVFESLAEWDEQIEPAIVLTHEWLAGSKRSAWFEDWCEIAEFGGSREIFLNL